jgi:hypothetical protein
MNWRRMLIATLLGLGAVLAACGGTGGGTPTATGAPAATPSGAPAGGGGSSTGGAAGGPVARGGDYCGLLGPGDFAAAGLAGAGAPSANPDPQGAYCVYAGRSGATGGIELDVFVGTDDADASAIFVNVRSFIDVGTGKAALPEADEVALLASAGGSPDYAVIAVRKGLLVFGISFPAGDGAQDRLVALARLVLARGDALTR